MPFLVLRRVVPASLCLVVLAACAAQPVVSTSAAPSYEGLQTVPSRRFARVEVRPGVDFTQYTAVFPQAPVLEFRTPDRSQQQFPLGDEQKQRLEEALVASLKREFADHSTLRFVDRAGPDTVSLEVRIIDIAAVVPPNSAGRVGRGAIALEATGNVTFVIEVRDSESGELLARGVETRAVSGVAVHRDDEVLTSWDDIDKLLARWAVASRTGLENLLGYDGS
jgi:Protein of unknown function (DUF3313)